jgi:hypothetical protein
MWKKDKISVGVSRRKLLKYLVYCKLKIIHTMAKLRTPFTFTGTLAGVTAYTRKDLDTPVLRTKGGPTKEQIESDDAFERTRCNISEFSGRSRTGKWVKQALMPLKLLADHNLGASLNPILKPIQEADTVSAHGKRHVELSKNPGLLEGFEVNRRVHLDSVVRNPVTCTISKESLSAQVEIGALLPGNNFLPQVALPFYRLVAALGPAPDIFFHAQGYRAVEGFEFTNPQSAYSDWFHTPSGSPAQTLALSLPQPPAATSFSLVLSLGISFGRMGARGWIEAVKYAGSGRILAAV